MFGGPTHYTLAGRPSIRPLLQVQPPDRPTPVAKRVPRRLRHLFWNTAESQLDVSHAGSYIARRLLRTMDIQGLAWGAQALKREDWEQAALARGLDPKITSVSLTTLRRHPDE